MKDNQKLNEKRNIIRKYIQTNSDCTYLDIRRDTKIKVERVNGNSLTLTQKTLDCSTFER